MFNSLEPKIRSLILDLDGVLWRGNQSIGNLPLIFQRIRGLGLSFVLATNNATRDVPMYIEKLASFNVSIGAEQVVNSCMAVVNLLLESFPKGGPVYIIGEKGLVSSLESSGFYFSEKDALAVVVGMDRQVTYQKLGIATHLIRTGSIFFGTNPDLTFPTPNGLMPGAGALLAAIEAATSQKPIIAGKPNPVLYQLAMQRLGTMPMEVLVVGDRLETDILGGQLAGCRTALVLSGVTGREEAEKWHPKPDIICEDISALLGINRV